MLNNQSLVTEISQLIQGCIKENRHDKNRLYQLFASRMFAVCMRYTKNKGETEEILRDL